MQVKYLAIALAVAACFGSNAQASYYQEGQGASLNVAGNVQSSDPKERVVGGWYVGSSANVPEGMSAEYSSNVNVTGGNFDYLIGASYVKKSGTYTLKESQVTIEGKDTFVRRVVGGQASADTDNLTFKGTSTHLTIKNGTFGKKYIPGENVLENTVVAGDLLKNQSAHTMSSSLASTNLVIEGGTFDAPVIGGSVAYGYYGTPTKLEAKVDKVNMTITGGTFNEPIIVGGMSGGHNAYSEVGSAELTISGASGNLQINSGIYTGSLIVNHESADPKAKVGNVVLNIDNATVKDIHDCDAVGTRPTQEENSDNHFEFGVDANESYVSKPTTDATLTNVVASNVVIQNENSSLTLGVADNGKTSISHLTVGEQVTVAMVADGATNDGVKGDVNSLLANHIVIGNEGAIKKATVTMAEGEAVGKVTGQIENGVLDESTVTEAVNQKSLDVTHMIGMMPRFVARVEMNELRKRMGDLRAIEGKNGVWARYDGGKLSGQGLEHTFNKIQVGADTMPTNDGVRFGLALSYTQGEVEGAASTADTDTYSLAGYGVWMGENGQFIDVIARMANVKTELKTAAYSADIDQMALSLSGEFGWRFDLTNSLFVEPSVEATYTYLEDETFKGTSSTFDIDSTNSFMTRVGTALGWKLPDARGDVYVRGGLVHEFMGDSKLSVDNGFRTVEIDGKDTWFEYAIGGNYKVSDSAYVYADLERSAGGDINTDWRVNIGARYVF